MKIRIKKDILNVCQPIEFARCIYTLEKYQDQLTQGAHLEAIHHKNHPRTIRVNKKIRIFLVPDRKRSGDFVATYILLNHKHSRLANKTLTYVSDDELEDLPVLPLPEVGNHAEEAVCEAKVEYYSQYGNYTFQLTSAQLKAVAMPFPSLTLGGAGAGKSCVGMEILKAAFHQWQQHPVKASFAYLTKNPSLALRMKRELTQLHLLSPEEEALLDVQFVTPQDLYLKIHPTQSDNLIINEKEHCITWIKEYISKTGKALFANQAANTLYQEFRLLSGYETLEIYLKKVGFQETMFPGQGEDVKKKKEYLFDAYKIYLQSLTKVVNLQFLPMSISRRYNLLVVDETQDFSGIQLSSLPSLVVDNKMAMLLSDHQSLDDNVNIRHYIKQLFHQKLSLNYAQLPLCHRSANDLIRFFNALLQFKHMLSHGLNMKDEIDHIDQNENNNKGYLSFLGSELAAKNAISSLMDHPSFAIIYDPSAEKEILALFGVKDGVTGQLSLPVCAYTIKESKGLEFDTVLSWKLCQSDLDLMKEMNGCLPDEVVYQPDHTISSRAKSNNPSNLSFNIKMNEIFVAATRAVEKLLVLETPVKNKRIKLIDYIKTTIATINNLEPGLDADQELGVVKQLVPLTDDEWRQHIFDLINTGNQRNRDKAIHFIREQFISNGKIEFAKSIILDLSLDVYFPSLVTRVVDPFKKLKPPTLAIASSSSPPPSPQSPASKVKAVNKKNKAMLIEKKPVLGLVNSEFEKKSFSLLLEKVKKIQNTCSPKAFIQALFETSPFYPFGSCFSQLLVINEGIEMVNLFFENNPDSLTDPIFWKFFEGFHDQSFEIVFSLIKNPRGIKLLNTMLKTDKHPELVDTLISFILSCPRLVDELNLREHSRLFLNKIIQDYEIQPWMYRNSKSANSATLTVSLVFLKAIGWKALNFSPLLQPDMEEKVMVLGENICIAEYWIRNGYDLLEKRMASLSETSKIQIGRVQSRLTSSLSDVFYRFKVTANFNSIAEDVLVNSLDTIMLMFLCGENGNYNFNPVFLLAKKNSKKFISLAMRYLFDKPESLPSLLVALSDIDEVLHRSAIDYWVRTPEGRMFILILLTKAKSGDHVYNDFVATLIYALFSLKSECEEDFLAFKNLIATRPGIDKKDYLLGLLNENLSSAYALASRDDNPALTSLLQPLESTSPAQSALGLFSSSTNQLEDSQPEHARSCGM